MLIFEKTVGFMVLNDRLRHRITYNLTNVQHAEQFFSFPGGQSTLSPRISTAPETL